MEQRFDGAVVMVTGVSGGIGGAVARLFAQRGAKVVLCGRDRTALEGLASTLPGAEILVFDQSNAQSVSEAVDGLASRHSGIDILVNAAGIYPACAAAEASVSHIESILDLNLKGAITLTQSVGRLMLLRGRGSVVHVSSLAAQRPAAGLSVYSASKAGLNAYCQALALEWSPAIRVNVVAPGPTRTDTVMAMLSDDDTGAAQSVAAGIPLGRLGEAEEVAEAILFLSSPAAAYITGVVLPVDGGRSLVC